MNKQMVLALLLLYKRIKLPWPFEETLNPDVKDEENEVNRI
jgi:hypothetical protein